MSGTSLGSTVLELKTNQAPLRQGLTEARAETIRQTEAMKAAARIELRANLLRLQADYNQAQRLAREASQRASQVSTFDLRANLAKFQSDLRQAERLQAESLRAMRQRASQAGGGGLLGEIGQGALSGIGFGGAAATAGIATAAALGAVAAGFDGVAKAGAAAVGVTLDYNAAVESAVVNIKAFTGSQTAVAYAQEIANRQLALGRSGYQDTLTALAELTPLARRYGASLQDLLTTTQLLAALDPAQGFQGAAIAIREALSGDFVSLARRFEIPREAIARLKAEGLPNLEIVRRALAELGITEQVLTDRAQTFTQRQAIALDTLRKFTADAGQPVFDTASDSLAAFIKLLNDPAMKQAGAAFGAELAKNINDVRHTLQELAGNADLRGIAQGLGDGAAAAGELYDSLEGVRRVVTLGGFERLLTVVRDFSLGVGVIGDSVSILVKDAAAFGRQVDELIDKVGALRRLRDAAGLGPGETATTGSPVRPEIFDAESHRANAPRPGIPPGSPAIPPPEEAQFDILAGKNEAERQRKLYQQGLADLQAYLRGFTAGDFDLFSKLGPKVQAAFADLFGNLDLSQQFAHGLGNLDVLTARLVDDIRKTGHVSSETADVARAALGSQAEGVIALANEYGQLAAAQDKAAQAATALASAQAELTRLQREAAQHQQEIRDNIEALQSSLSALNKEAAVAARSYDEQLRGLQANLTALQRAGEEAQRQFSAQIEAIQRAGAEAQKHFQSQIEAAQKEQEAIQRAAQQHADAFAAILSGNTDEFLSNKQAENEALDEQTRRILELGQAYQQYAREATAADHAVRALDEQEAQTRLEFDRRIQAARARGGAAGESAARALERERDRVLAQQRQAGQVTRDEAVVAGQKAEDARDPLEQERRRVAEQDKINGAAADKRVAEIQEQAKARAAADQAAIDAIQEQAKERAESDRVAAQALQDRIADVQEEARRVAEDYRARSQAIQDTIDKEEERGRVIARIDQKAIDDAQTRVDNARTVKDQADLEVIAQGKITDALSSQNTLLDERFKAWRKFYDEVLKPAGAIIAQFMAGQPPAPPAAPPGYTTSPVPGNVDDPSQRSNNPPPSGPETMYLRMAALPTYTAPAAPTSYYRAPVPPALNVSSYTAGLAGASLAPTGGGGANATYVLNRELIHIDTVNASDPAEVDTLIRRVKDEALDEVFGLDLSAFETARRGELLPGWRRQ